MASAVDHEESQPNETTALLENRPAPFSQTSSTAPPHIQPRRPAINPLAKRIQRQGLHTLDDASIFPSLSSSTEEVAYRLLVVLRLLAIHQTPRISDRDVYVQWEQEEERISIVGSLESRVSLIWNGFIESGRLGDEIQTCLWTAFPLDEGDAPLVRGVCKSWTSHSGGLLCMTNSDCMCFQSCRLPWSS